MSIDFIEFKKILNENNIQLFDAQYRIAHHRFNHLNHINRNDQKGGSNVNLNNREIISNIIKNRPASLLSLINSLLNKNTIRINYIIDNYSK